MFEAAELGRSIDRATFRREEPTLRAALLAEQVRLREAAAFPVIVIFAGVDGAGKGETVNLLSEWLDPRWLVTRAFGPPSDEERERPEYWRFWRELPPRGRMGLFLSSWYSVPVLDRVNRRIDAAAFEERLNRIVEFEGMLAEGGALILKFWMHLDRERQRKRLRKLERDPLTRWRVTRREWAHWKLYDRFIDAAELTIRRTSRGGAPWTIVEGADHAYRSLTVGQALLTAVRQRLGEQAVPAVSAAPVEPALPPRTTRARGVPRPTQTSILGALDMSLTVPPKRLPEQLERYQGRLNRLQRRAASRGVSTIVVFEGWDAAGKGGAIRRITGALDARDYQVVPIAAPTDEERQHHYLWRFWRHLSRAGRVTIFDRSWYGRVLVERVEGFATEREWSRAYSEITQFEDQLVAHGIVVVKFWLHVTPAEQLRRFRNREATAHKRWKLTPEDWRNREKWPLYEQAVNEMVERTSTHHAPWTLVEADDKGYARIKVLRTVCERLAV
jgi:polyphosphate:AMP phosphotransferase